VKLCSVSIWYQLVSWIRNAPTNCQHTVRVKWRCHQFTHCLFPVSIRISRLSGIIVAVIVSLRPYTATLYEMSSCVCVPVHNVRCHILMSCLLTLWSSLYSLSCKTNISSTCLLDLLQPRSFTMFHAGQVNLYDCFHKSFNK